MTDFFPDDPDLNRAAADARRTIGFFWRELEWENHRIIPALDMSAVKFALFEAGADREAALAADPPQVEYIWMSDPMFDGREIRGTLVNDPHFLKGYEAGQAMSVSPDDVVDWMYVSNDDVFGGFTVEVIRIRQSDEERDAHDEAWGLDFGEVGEIFVIPREYWPDDEEPEEFEAYLEAARQIEHPMSINMRESLQDALKKEPAMLKTPDYRGLPMLHAMSLAGSDDGVEECLKAGADPAEAAGNGLTPLDIATAMNWPRVVARLKTAVG